MQISVDFAETNSVFNFSVNEIDEHFDFVLDGSYHPASGIPYEGEYVVNPKWTATILPSEGCYMESDVTVNAIECQRVSNLSGGKTVYIGGIIHG